MLGKINENTSKLGKVNYNTRRELRFNMYGIMNTITGEIIIPFEYDDIYLYNESHVCKLDNESLCILEKPEVENDYNVYPSENPIYSKYVKKDDYKIIYSFKTPITLAFIDDEKHLYDITGEILYKYTGQISYVGLLLKYAKTQIRKNKLKYLIN